MEERQQYQVAYVTPPIEKVVTDFILPPVVVTEYLRATLANDFLGVYFIQSAEGFVKIGKSNDILRRLSAYRTHHPMTRLVGFISCAPGYLDYNENLLHRLWEPFIVSLEWFAPVRPLIEYIKAFDGDGLGHPLELIEEEPGTWQELLSLQKKLKSMRDIHLRAE